MRVGCIDFTNPAAVRVYQSHLRRLFDLGARVIDDLVVRYAYAEGRHRVDAPPGLEVVLDVVGPQAPAIDLR